MAVDREFSYILFTCIWFCDLLSSFRCPSTSFFSPWADFGVLLGLFGQPLDHFGKPWDAMEVALGCLGAYARFWTKQDFQFRANGSQE